MFYNIVFQIDKKFSGYQFFSAFLKVLPKEISSQIHEQRKPFSISPFFVEDEKFFIKFGFFGDEFLGEILSSFINKEIFVGKEKIKILQVFTNHLSNRFAQFATLEFLENLAKETNSFSLKFFSPTFFKNGDEIISIPEKKRIFNSLLKKFLKTNLVKFEEEKKRDFENFIDKNLFQISSKIETRKKKFRNFSIEGFVGESIFEFRNIDEKNFKLKNFVALLAKTSDFFGVGNKTNFGFGNVKFKKLN